MCIWNQMQINLYHSNPVVKHNHIPFKLIFIIIIIFTTTAHTCLQSTFVPNCTHWWNTAGVVGTFLNLLTLTFDKIKLFLGSNFRTRNDSFFDTKRWVFGMYALEWYDAKAFSPVAMTERHERALHANTISGSRMMQAMITNKSIIFCSMRLEWHQVRQVTWNLSDED